MVKRFLSGVTFTMVLGVADGAEPILKSIKVAEGIDAAGERE